MNSKNILICQCAYSLVLTDVNVLSFTGRCSKTHARKRLTTPDPDCSHGGGYLRRRSGNNLGKA